jgi:hypothetical protein
MKGKRNFGSKNLRRDFACSSESLGGGSRGYKLNLVDNCEVEESLTVFLPSCFRVSSVTRVTHGRDPRHIFSWTDGAY